MRFIHYHIISVRFGLTQALLQAINNANGREDIIEPAVCALRHITSRHPSAEMAQNTVRQVGGIPVVATFLHQQCRWPLLKVHAHAHVCFNVVTSLILNTHMYINECPRSSVFNVASGGTLNLCSNPLFQMTDELLARTRSIHVL